jgi:pilus assembly protein CpaF
MTTVHANAPRDAFSRLETMVMMADLEIPARVILQQLASAVKVVVQVSRLQDGTRKILSISEVLGVDQDKVELQEIFTFERIGVTDSGKVQGRFKATGATPKILERLRVSGVQLPPAIFEEVVPVNL